MRYYNIHYNHYVQISQLLKTSQL